MEALSKYVQAEYVSLKKNEREQRASISKVAVLVESYLHRDSTSISLRIYNNKAQG